MVNEHPLGDDLTKLSFDELEQRLTQLNKRWYAAKRMNLSYDVLYQLDLLLQGVEYERQRRSHQQEEKTGVIIDTDVIREQEK